MDALEHAGSPREVHWFLCSDGAASTTTVRTLLGLVRQTAGTIRRLGGAHDAGGAILDRVVALIEGSLFYPFFSTQDALFARSARGRVLRSRVGEVLDLVDLADRPTDQRSTYSLWEKQSASSVHRRSSPSTHVQGPEPRNRCPLPRTERRMSAVAGKPT